MDQRSPRPPLTSLENVSTIRPTPSSYYRTISTRGIEFSPPSQGELTGSSRITAREAARYSHASVRVDASRASLSVKAVDEFFGELALIVALDHVF
jgi:hypothetical protein